MKKFIQVTVFVLLLALCLPLSACVVNEPPSKTTPTPEMTPSESTPEAISPVESTPEAISPEESTPEESTPEVTPPESTTPDKSEPSPTDILKARSFFYTIVDAHLERLTPEQLAGDECVTLRCFGIYENNGVSTYVVRIVGPHLPSPGDTVRETIGSQSFVFTGGQVLEAFIREPYNNRLCTLKEAYEAGAITDEQLATVNERYKTGKETVVRSEDLTLEHGKEKVIEAYAEKDSLNPAAISLRYLGYYNYAFVAFIDVPGRAYFDEISKVQIGNHTVVYRDSQVMTVYYKNEFYSLEKAYEEGILSDDDIAEIIEKHSGQLYLVATIN